MGDPVTEAIDDLAAKLEAGATKAALARMVSHQAIVRGTVFGGRSVVAVGAEVRSELTQHEEIVALQRHGRGNQERVKS